MIRVMGFWFWVMGKIEWEVMDNYFFKLSPLIYNLILITPINIIKFQNL